MKNRRVAFLIGLMIMLTSGRLLADDEVKPLPSPHVKLTTGDGTLVAPDGQKYFLPLGTHILDGTSWQKLDDETHRLQDQETRLKTENESLKKSMNSWWEPGWGTVVVLTGLAIATGTVVYFTN